MAKTARYSLGVITYPSGNSYQIIDGRKLADPRLGRNSAALARRFHGKDRTAAQAEVDRLNARPA